MDRAREVAEQLDSDEHEEAHKKRALILAVSGYSSGADIAARQARGRQGVHHVGQAARQGVAAVSEGARARVVIEEVSAPFAALMQCISQSATFPRRYERRQNHPSVTKRDVAMPQCLEYRSVM